MSPHATLVEINLLSARALSNVTPLATLHKIRSLARDALRDVPQLPGEVITPQVSQAASALEAVADPLVISEPGAVLCGRLQPIHLNFGAPESLNEHFAAGLGVELDVDFDRLDNTLPSAQFPFGPNILS